MKRQPALTIALSLCLLLSIGANVYLFHRTYQRYRLHHADTLDPLGIARFDVPAAPPRSQDRTRVVIYGDSRAKAWTAPSAPAGYDFLNLGINGQTTAQVLARFDAHVAPLQPDVILVQVGINDLKTIPLFPKDRDEIVATCKANIAAIVEKGRALDATVILTTIFPLGRVPLTHRPFWSPEVARAVAEVNAYLITLAGERVVLFETTPLLARPDGAVQSVYSRDLLHINRAGYDVLNEAMVSHLIATQQR